MTPDQRLEGNQRVVFRSAPVLRTAISLSVLLTASALFGWYMLPEAVRVQFTWPQVATLLFFIAFMVAMMFSIALSQVVADKDGLTVRNCVVTKRHPWNEVTGVTFGSGDAWPYLQLVSPDARTDDEADDDHVEAENRMLLGIQRVEGDRAIERVQELRALIAAHHSVAP